LLQTSYPQGIITFNIKPKDPAATVPKKDIIMLLPYLGLHSNHITKRLKSCVNRFQYSFVNVKVIFQNTRQGYFSNTWRSQLGQRHLQSLSLAITVRPTSFTKLVAGTAMTFTLGKLSEDSTTGKRNISRPF